MRRLIVVSNRLPRAAAGGSADERRVPVGGLASALRGALSGAPGSLWFGWNGVVAKATAARSPSIDTIDDIRVAGVPLTEREASRYYRGFCNGAIWPLFHGFLGRVKLDREDLACYREVNARFARALHPLLDDRSLVWVHDYHLICLGRELRKLGWNGPIGFFLHIPFPPFDHWQVLPEAEDFLRAMMSFDLVGFQTRTSLDNYAYCCHRLLGAAWEGGRLQVGGLEQGAGVHPVGIEPADFAPRPPAGRAVRTNGLTRVVRGRQLILGVDRLDYTKGIPERILAFEGFLKAHPEWRRKVSFVQIASPSRSRVPEYVEQKRRVDLLVGRVNGEMADHDWVPIRYLYRSYPPRVLAGFYRESAVGLVTPLRDGMNLIAKEFVAAQDPRSPGVLVLSRFAGAAEELQEAILVNPHLPSDTAEGIAEALAMPLKERLQRHAALLERISRRTASDWSRGFLRDLEAAASHHRTPGPRGVRVRGRQAGVGL